MPNAHASSSKILAAYALPLLAASAAWAQGQPAKPAPTPGGFEIVGDSVVSAQQMFLGTEKRVYIVDKVENNPTQINGHPAWAAEYSLDTNKGRPMDIVTNSFCAGGGVLGNGTWVNVGGNQGVTYGGLSAPSQQASAPYFNGDGGQSLRLLDPCDDQSCNWAVHADNAMSTRRWYPTVETLPDGSVIIIGGDQWGGFVNSAGNNNPTYEFFPYRGQPISLPLLETTLPANLYPITYLLPSGNIYLQLNWATAILDYNTNADYPLNDVPDAVRTYPASAGNAMLPLTPANNWTATILMCGGTNLQPDQWAANWNLAVYPASASCVKITPDVSGSYSQEDPLPEGRVMVSFVNLPTGEIFGVNGANTGCAGYDNVSWAVGQSFADNAVLQPILYDDTRPAGKKWSKDGLSASTVPRMYHSGAILMPDGAVFVSGSNPNADFTTGVKFETEYRVEYFYPPYYNQRRPEPQGLPTSLSYGGNYFNLTLTKDDLFGDLANLDKTAVVLQRPGFSTHALAMGQRLVQLNNTYTGNPSDGSATLHVAQMPPNPAILAPAPAIMFVVVNGVPSMGKLVMVGSGKIEKQAVLPVQEMPAKSGASAASSGGSDSSSGNARDGKSSGAEQLVPSVSRSGFALAVVASVLALLVR